MSNALKPSFVSSEAPSATASIPPTLVGDYPRSGNALTRWFGRLGLRVLGGWRLRGDMPQLTKMIIPVAPHTSNWDFFVGLFAKFALGMKISFLGKHTLFRFPINGILRGLGGLPVNRAAAGGVVGQMVAEFKQRQCLILALAPEGTRKTVAEWKTGFLHIAHQAAIPVVPVAFDFSKRFIDIGEPTMINADIEAELIRIKTLVSHAVGKNAMSSEAGAN